MKSVQHLNDWLRSTARSKPLKLRQTRFFKDLFVAAYCHENILSGLPMGANISSGAHIDPSDPLLRGTGRYKNTGGWIFVSLWFTVYLNILMTPLKGKKLTAIFSSQNTETIFTLYRHGGSFFTIRRLRSTARAKPLKLRQTGFF